MSNKRRNHPFVTWAACLLWLVSMFALTWSLLLFFCIGDMLLLTGTDLVNAFTLLSGLLMFPTNVYILYSIATGRVIDHKAKVICCPLWLSIFWIIIINLIGVILCIRAMNSCHEIITSNLLCGIKNYRTMPKYKHFVDNLQWSLKCCGLKSYKDWFALEWHDKIRDYEWDFVSKRNVQPKKDEYHHEIDSVPFSCCKSGSCISNYLKELGTYSINTDGCADFINRIVMISMNAHLIVFLLIIIIQILLLKFICVKREKKDVDNNYGKRKVSVRHIMPINDYSDASSQSYLSDEEQSDIDISKKPDNDNPVKYMVFLTVANWVRARGPDEFWRKRRIFRLAAHFIGRRRNCYSVALRNVHRALVYSTTARKLKKDDMKVLWNTRITAACEQHNITPFTLQEGLGRANIMLDRKSLADLASWEPRTFKCLTAIAKEKLDLDGFNDSTDIKAPTGMNLNLKDVMLEAWLKEKK